GVRRAARGGRRSSGRRISPTPPCGCPRVEPSGTRDTRRADARRKKRSRIARRATSGGEIMPLADAVRQARHPHKQALIVGDRGWTYEQFDEITDRIGASLLRRGI